LARIIAEADCFETVECSPQQAAEVAQLKHCATRNEAISGSINNHLQTARLVILKAKPKVEHASYISTALNAIEDFEGLDPAYVLMWLTLTWTHVGIVLQNLSIKEL
jgi:hypothetical protein